MLRHTILIFLAATGLLCGQELPADAVPAPFIYPPPPVAFNELKQFLNLTDTQLDQLRAILTDKDKARQQVYEQIRQKQMEVQNLLSSGSRDSVRIGQLTIDIYLLQRESAAPTDQYRQRALAVLTPDQRVKLGQLEQVLKLSAPAHQAVTLDLVDPPSPGRPIILTTPALEADPSAAIRRR